MTYLGKKMQLGSQIKLIDTSNSLIWEEQFVEPAAKYVSSRLEAVWWMPSNNCDTKFIISNTTDAPVTATITIDGTSPGQKTPTAIQLNAHETRVLDVIRDLVGKNNGTIHTTGGVSISHTGAAGAILARMLIAKANKGFSSTMNFIDPEMTASSRWHGTGLHLGSVNNQKLQQILIARNVGNETTTVSGKIPYTNNDGEVVTINIPPTNIAANSTRTINLQNAIDAANVPPSVKYAGLEMNYTTAKGSVVMSAVNVSADDNQVFQVPLYDPQKTGSNAGGYPWKADGDFTTVVYIKNDTDQPQQYIARMVYPGGFYMLGLKDLKPREMAAIDFRSMRDNLTPDAMGNTIPLNLSKGQILWSVYGEENYVLNGRSEQISLTDGVSSTYDCRNCCPDSTIIDDVIPDSTEADVGDLIDFFEEGRDINCYGQTTPMLLSNGNWTSSDSAVAIIGSNGRAQAMAGGIASLNVSWTSREWLEEGSTRRCQLNLNNGNGAGEMMVRPTITITPFEAVGKGSTLSVSVQVTGNSNNTPITLRLTKLSGTGESQFSNNSSTIIIYQSGNVVIKGITESSAKDNYIIETIINNQVQTSSASKDRFSIAKIKISRTIGTQQPTEITDMTTVTIVGERIKLNAEIVPSGITASNHLWMIPGMTMKDFLVTPNPTDPTQSSSQVVPVTGLNTTNIDYVWYDGADNRVVSYQANIGSSQITGKTTFNVKRPGASVITISTNNSMTTIDSATGALELHVGLNSAQQAGIRFSLSSITIPSPFTGGDKQWVQTINRTITATSTSGQTGMITQTGLDGCYPYDVINAPSTFDSPGTELSAFTYAKYDAQWSMWLMYKPTGSDSSWVPLRKVNWHWFAEAQLMNSVWNLINHTDPNQPIQPVDMDTISFPIWSYIVPSLAGGPCP